MDETNQTKTAGYRRRYSDLKQEADSWRSHWKELADYIKPFRSRYLSGDTDDTNRGSKKHSKIINGSADDSARVLAAGMQGGLTSPARPWFAFTLADKKLAEYAPVREYLYKVRELVLMVLQRSNFYTATHSVYKELGIFGTGANLIDEDFKSVIRCRPFTVGEYYLGLDSSYRPNSLYRQFSMSAGQMVEKFGEESVSRAVKNIYKRSPDKRFEVMHVIEPRGYVDPEKKDFRGKPYVDVYFELTGDQDKTLREGGYNSIPFVAPRWDVSGVDTYGTDCPGMAALGDVKMLQKMEEKSIKALDKMIDPPMNAPTSMKGKGGTIIAGGVNYVDQSAGAQKFEPAHIVNLNIQNVEFKIERVEQRIQRFFYHDLFLAIIQNEKSMTATEVAKRWEEKLIVLGAVIERLQSEFLAPSIDRVFNILLEMNLLPPPPPELEGTSLEIEYISLLAQAQKLVGTTGIEQVSAFVGSLAAVFPNVVDKFDADEAVDQYADAVGVAPSIIRSDDVVAELRAEKAKQAQAQQAGAAAMQAAEGAKVLSDTKVGENNALEALMGMPQ